MCKNKSLSGKNKVLESLKKYCSLQERCTSQVVQKAEQKGIESHEMESILTRLRADDFLDDDRFAEIFVRSKLHQNKWGRIKIAYALYQKQFDREKVQNAMETIDDAEYFETALSISEKKLATINDAEIWTRKQKLRAYLQSKGFEKEVIEAVVKQLV